jgi:hypothetical protein
MTARAKLLLLHLPSMGLLLILGFIVLVDAGVLASLRNESTFGWMLLVWYPLGVLLGLIQIALWVGWIVKQRRKQRDPELRGIGRRVLFAGFLIAIALIAGLLLFRMAQRWGLFE